jgi:hypothetical protein
MTSDGQADLDDIADPLHGTRTASCRPQVCTLYGGQPWRSLPLPENEVPVGLAKQVAVLPKA